MRLETLLLNPFFVIFGLLGIGLLAVVYGTFAKNSWGVNLSQIFCPRCTAPLPKARKPRSGRQSLWGGCTCSACGAEADKWGREVHVRPGWWSEFYNGPRSMLPARLAFLGLIAALDVWYDLHYQTVSFFSAAVIIGFVVWAVKSNNH